VDRRDHSRDRVVGARASSGAPVVAAADAVGVQLPSKCRTVSLATHPSAGGRGRLRRRLRQKLCWTQVALLRR
jgi:hypothetical protein